MPRVKITLDSKNTQYGEFLGLIQDENGDTRVIVRVDGQGLQLMAARPHMVEFISDNTMNSHTHNAWKDIKSTRFNEYPTLSTEQIQEYIYKKDRKD